MVNLLLFGSNVQGIASLMHCQWVAMLAQSYDMILTATLANLSKENQSKKS